MFEEPEPFGYKEASEAVDCIGDKAGKAGLAMPRISVTLGSGLGSFAARYTNPDSCLVIPTPELPHFAQPRRQAPGHGGRLIIAPIEDGSEETMAIWEGRNHFYQRRLYQKIKEQWLKITDPEVRKAAVGFYIAICKRLGIQDILTSNAVGSSDPQHQVGDIVRVSDQIMDPEYDFGVPEEPVWFAEKMVDGTGFDYNQDAYFYGQGQLYSNELHQLAQEVARGQGWELTEGVLNWREGRGFETPAYVKTRAPGVTLFGMSTAPEVQKARSIGYSNQPGKGHFAAFSLVVNIAQSGHDQQISNREGNEAGRAYEDRFNPFMFELIKRRRAARLASACLRTF